MFYSFINFNQIPEHTHTLCFVYEVNGERNHQKEKEGEIIRVK